jgi:DNA mismatch endonuclease (patch repair protein)
MTDRVTKKQRSRNMAAVRSSNTLPEVTVRSILHKLGVRFRLHQRTLPGTPDIVLKRHKTVVFVHGCFWHGHDCPRGKTPGVRPEFWVPKLERNRERDHANATSLRKHGWRVVTVWECQLRKPSELARRLKRALSTQRPRERPQRVNCGRPSALPNNRLQRTVRCAARR